MTFSFSKSIHCHVAILSKQNASTINTIYGFKDTLVKLLMVVLINKFNTRLSEALNFLFIKLFMYFSGKIDGDCHILVLLEVIHK